MKEKLLTLILTIFFSLTISAPDFVIAYPRSYRQRVFQWVCDVS